MLPCRPIEVCLVKLAGRLYEYVEEHYFEIDDINNFFDAHRMYNVRSLVRLNLSSKFGIDCIHNGT